MSFSSLAFIRLLYLRTQIWDGEASERDRVKLELSFWWLEFRTFFFLERDSKILVEATVPFSFPSLSHSASLVGSTASELFELKKVGGKLLQSVLPISSSLSTPFFKVDLPPHLLPILFFPISLQPFSKTSTTHPHFSALLPSPSHPYRCQKRMRRGNVL